jgi:SAM-dependent methyltransferase
VLSLRLRGPLWGRPSRRHGLHSGRRGWRRPSRRADGGACPGGRAGHQQRQHAAIELARQSGAHHVFDYKRDDVAAKIEYNEPAARDAKQKLRAFLAANLDGAAAGQSHVGASGFVIGADISPAMLEGARARLNEPLFWPVAADGQALPFSDASFDCVICQLGLQFFPNPALGLAEFRRVLRSGGSAAVCVRSWTQGHEDWLGAHVCAFAYIGGCPKKVIPDNLKTGVTDANYWDPVLNRSYHALGRHYNVAIVPARVRKPRDNLARPDRSAHIRIT